MNKVLQLLRRSHTPDVEALSAHLDGRLGSAEAITLTAHIASCEACRAELDALSMTRSTLRALPSVEHPRSFRLRQADVEPVAIRAAGGVGRAMRWLPAISGVAAAIFLGVVALDVAGSSSTSSMRSASAPRPQVAAERDMAAGMTAGDSAGAAFSTSAPSSIDAPLAGQPTPAVAADIVTQDGNAATGTVDGTLPGASAPPASATATGEKATNPSPTPELAVASSRHTDSDGGPGALLWIEIIAGAVAIVTGVGAIAWRTRRGGEQA